MDANEGTHLMPGFTLESFLSRRPYTVHLLAKIRESKISQMKVLDLGCGSELLDIHAFARLGAPISVGVDMCDGVKLEENTESVHFIRADFDDFSLPFDDDIFDLILMHNVIEHLHNPLQVLEEAGRVLKPAGLLSIVTENQTSLKNRLRLLLGGSVYFPIDRFMGANDQVIKGGRKVFTGHVREYTENELRKMIARSGLEVESIMLHPAASKSGRNFGYSSGSCADSITKLSNSRVFFSMYHVAELAVPSWRYMMSAIARKA